MTVDAGLHEHVLQSSASDLKPCSQCIMHITCNHSNTELITYHPNHSNKQYMFSNHAQCLSLMCISVVDLRGGGSPGNSVQIPLLLGSFL